MYEYKPEVEGYEYEPKMKGGTYNVNEQYFPSYDPEESKVRIIHDREYPPKYPYKYIAGEPGPLHFGRPYSDGIDPGVFAVSNALFARNSAFMAIPLIPNRNKVFRKRKSNDVLSEWSNAFVTRVDPCECQNPEQTYDPYKVFRFRNKNGVVTSSANYYY